MKLTLGISPCPNDTFIFDALINQRFDTEGIEFELVMEDVEALNQMAMAAKLHITKLSFHALGFVNEHYALMHSGAALGSGVGPLLISKHPIDAKDLGQANIAIPGKYTTANFLLSIALPNATNKSELLFSEIEDAVLDERFDAGLIIHENRFTYQERGLHKIMDMGAFWEAHANALIPLGGIVVRRDLPEEIQRKVDRLLKKSVEYAFQHPEASKAFVGAHSQEMSPEVCQKHIDLYVNKYSVDLGEEGRRAVEVLFEKAHAQKVIPSFNKPIFVAQN